MLSPEEERPEFFSLHDAGEKYRFDQKRIGLTAPDVADVASVREAAMRGDRDVYWTKRVGHSNSGHSFYTNLPADQKTALLEYLKTL